MFPFLTCWPKGTAYIRNGETAGLNGIDPELLTCKELMMKLRCNCFDDTWYNSHAAYMEPFLKTAYRNGCRECVFLTQAISIGRCL